MTDKTSFESVIKSEFVRVDQCLKGSNSISCNNNSGLFTSNSGKYHQIVGDTIAKSGVKYKTGAYLHFSNSRKN